MINKSLFTSNSEEWATPQAFLDELNKEFNFTLDPCATKENTKCKKFFTKEDTKCKKFFTKEDNGLVKSWGGARVFCNPPYGRQIKDWVKKSAESNTLVVMLIPARTDTKYFHDYIYKKKNVEIRFIKGRLKFGDAINSAPFPSMIVIFKV